MTVAAPWSPEGLPDLMLYTGPANSYRGNIHDELKLVVATGGYQVERRGTRHTAGPDELIALHADDAHSGTAPEPDPGHWRIISCPPTLVSAVCGTRTPRFEPPVLPEPALAARFHAVFDLFETPVGTDERTDALLELVALLTPFAGRSAQAVTQAEAAVLRALRGHLVRHLTRQVSLQELADETGVQKYHLVRLCTAHLGVAPHTLHLRLRLDRTRRLLRDGARLSDIAHVTGFHDHAHFTRTFQRAYGVSPSAYRSHWRRDDPRNRKLTVRP